MNKAFKSKTPTTVLMALYLKSNYKKIKNMGRTFKMWDYTEDSLKRYEQMTSWSKKQRDIHLFGDWSKQ